MRVLRLAFKNSLRHSLRSVLTVLGLALAIAAFGVVRTLISAWYLQAENSAPDRLVTRNAVSLVFDLPLAYGPKIAQVNGVKRVSYANWFGGVYKDPRNFFPQFACDFETYLDMYPEYIISAGDREALLGERNACMVGRQLAAKYGFNVGDAIRLVGTIYPGDWDFVVRAVYSGREPNTDEGSLLFNWDYLDERMAAEMPGRAGRVGFYVIQIADPSRSADVSESIDALFANSTAETLTETEKAFALGFVSMSSAIITGIRLVSILIIGVVLLVLANTMAMSVRERMNEYAVLKTLGFGQQHLSGLIAGESLLLAGIGTATGVLLLMPVTGALAVALSDFFPVLFVQPWTVVWSAVIGLGVGLIAALFPVWRVLTATIVEGLRQIG